MTLSSLLLSLMLLLLLSCNCVIGESTIDASDFTVAAAEEPPTDNEEQWSDWKSSKLKVNDESKLSSVSEDNDAAAVVTYLDDRDSAVKSSAHALSDHAIDAANVDDANADSNGNIFTVNQRFGFRGLGSRGFGGFRGLRGGFFGRGFGFRRGLGFFGRGRRFRRFGFGRGAFGFGGFRRFPFFPFRRFGFGRFRGFGLGGFFPGFGLGFGVGPVIGLAAYCPFLWDPLAACAYCGICY